MFRPGTFETIFIHELFDNVCDWGDMIRFGGGGEIELSIAKDVLFIEWLTNCEVKILSIFLHCIYGKVLADRNQIVSRFRFVFYKQKLCL